MHVPGTYNVRDLGAMPLESGKQTVTGQIIRSGNLDKLPETSQALLLNAGVQTVIDIRNEWEAAHYPNVFENSPDVVYQNLPLIGDSLSDNPAWQTESKNYVHLHELYIKYVQRCQPQIAAIVNAIVTAESAVIFHCHAGKDRTGIIAALLLRAVGVPLAAIADDYRISSDEIPHLIAEWRQYAESNGQDMAHFERKIASKPETILKMLAFIEENYGSTAQYLSACGVSDAVLQQLEANFVR